MMHERLTSPNLLVPLSFSAFISTVQPLPTFDRHMIFWSGDIALRERII